MKWLFPVLLAISTTTMAAIATPQSQQQPNRKNTINTIIQEHLQKYGKTELFSAIQVSIKTRGKIDTYAAGHHDLDADSSPITSTDLFNIGSITKSFTAALAVLAESEGKLQLQRSLSHYLSDYSHWGEINLTSLLNMSSGIPNYSESPKMNYLMSKNLKHYWRQQDLINLVYSEQFNPPRKSGYFYSNTGYVLVELILTQAYNTPFQNLIVDKIIKPLNLQNTFYPVPDYPGNIKKRLVKGYSYNVYENPELLGQDVSQNNLSWAGAAGALIANSEDVVHWVEELFLGDKLLNSAQKEKMQTLISISSGLPLRHTNANDPYGFGLGISQRYQADIGRYWFYEGETLGYRALYMYVPCNKVIISALFNSATNEENDHAGELVQKLYKHLLQQNQMLICGKKQA
ncbi:(serine-type) D-alanyl-D-alanine carboxypeptidase [Legionella lansingensis]|uniref:(Serine-type) D-alanyl-D-alanine carboxypeptidase n=1 Tax=Legionella lansingensis TaxID=45067 RepID=A0A0W0VLB5_9GAMM|nr:serine hydrolase [Legionella lansingensis]KTD20912.1 (serine-type) D-alanyl-D-alanine carboxypeptidase [Legionella lansingensis]SNV44206.1 (serine-type) D-alanyl-D-alanine carboxypeptidase [Legionella lansingensis]